MTETKSVNLSFDVPGDNFDRAGEASAKLKRTLQHIGVPAAVIRRIAIGSYEGEINLIIHAGGGQLQAQDLSRPYCS
jgi:anti-sigma regulatory factor (Ser/Thr protein kinase)